MRRTLLSRNFYLIIILDALLVAVAYILAYWLRFDGVIQPERWANIKDTVQYVIPAKMICFFFFGLYKGMWRYTSLSDLKNVFLGVSSSSAIIVLFILFLYRFQGFSRSVYLIDWGLTMFLIGGVRITIRLYFSAGLSPFKENLEHKTHPLKRLLIIGAGDAGEKVLREIKAMPWLNIHPIGFLDDDFSKQGKTIHGIPILGAVDEINTVKNAYDEILIAMPSIRGEEMRKVVSLCEQTGKAFRTLPGIWELVEGRVSVKTTRKVRMEDLLKREEIHLNEDDIRQYIRKKRVMITGAGGSIGSELVRQVCRFNPESVALVEVGEENLFKIEMECRQRYGFIPIFSYLCDVKQKANVDRIVKTYCPYVIFHAAAYKHVPIQELNPWEAIFNNVLGTRNMIESAYENKVGRFVLVSTDKAVRPTNVMGATKRAAEILIQCINGRSQTIYMAVRFGNVLWSSGSALPLFQKQISHGGPVTVTHPEIVRYFMSIPEAVQLVLQAGSMGSGGEVFILDMGEPIRIVDLARDLIRLNGYEPERDILIQYIGLRPGEKLYEELITEGEGIVATKHEKILTLNSVSCDYKRLKSQIDELISIAGSYDAVAIKKKLQEIVPEYTPQL
ncbi:MAG: polysaccharide biosynthesis protein [Deltaproteobacteria bacterium]|nr:polysaccharide biosynthesis protein [Deltaproteobacteria bacterium]